jgi:glutathione S-transferase
MLLYGHPLSGNTHKVRLLLGFLGLAYEERTIDIPRGEGQSSRYLAISPLGQVPALVDGELTLRDAQAILVYLAGRYGDGAWWPAAPAEQGLVAQWLSFAANEVQHGPNLARLHFLLGVPVDLPAVQEAARKALGVLDAHLASREWLELGRPTIADCACAPYAALAAEGGVPSTGYRAVTAWLERVKVLPGFVGMPGFA